MPKERTVRRQGADEMKLMQKIIITISAGFLYWLTIYGIMKFFVLMNIAYSDNIGKLLYFLMPLLFGAVLIILIKEKNYLGVIYSAMIIIVRYIITLLEVTLRQPIGPSPFEQTLFLFKLMGGYSMSFAALGGILGVFLNKKVFKR